VAVAAGAGGRFRGVGRRFRRFRWGGSRARRGRARPVAGPAEVGPAGRAEPAVVGVARTATPAEDHDEDSELR